MNVFWHALRNDERGVLSFEWVLLLTLLTVGVIGGIVGARDAMVDELGDISEAMLALDDSFTIAYPLQISVDLNSSGDVQVIDGASNSGFQDRSNFQDCDRISIEGQTP